MYCNGKGYKYTRKPGEQAGRFRKCTLCFNGWVPKTGEEIEFEIQCAKDDEA